jgi:hypothetical protein
MNPKGEHWEDTEFLTLNDKLLSTRGGSWHAPRKIVKTTIYGLEVEAKELIKERSQDMLWGWKDPRNSFTLEFWANLLDHTRIIWVHRNGIDVAKSLARREQGKNRGLTNYDIAFWFDLWAIYQIACSTYLPGFNIHHVFYEQICVEPYNVMAGIGKFLELKNDFVSPPAITKEPWRT